MVSHTFLTYRVYPRRHGTATNFEFTRIVSEQTPAVLWPGQSLNPKLCWNLGQPHDPN